MSSRISRDIAKAKNIELLDWLLDPDYAEHVNMIRDEIIARLYGKTREKMREEMQQEETGERS